MATPTSWSAPASGGTIASTDASFHDVYHAGDYWFSIARIALSETSDAGPLRVRYASDPTGTWSTATMPNINVGVSNKGVLYADSGGVQFDGTHYAFSARFNGVGGGSTVQRILYATDPAGTWTAHQWDATEGYRANALLYDGSRWVMMGYQETAASPQPAFIAYTAAGSAVTSTWTVGTSDAATGYAIADLGGTGTRAWQVTALGFDGTNYVASATKIANSVVTSGYLRYCTDITAASWGTPTTTQVEQVNQFGYSNGYWHTVGPNPIPYYATDPTATWGSITASQSQMDAEVLGLTYGNGYWVAVGRDSSPSAVPAMSYLQAASPSGTYGSVTSAEHGFGTNSSQIIYTVAYANDGYMVAGANIDTVLRWCFVGVPASTAPTILRQRQSPKRTPARVRGVDLRQRQTPFIT